MLHYPNQKKNFSKVLKKPIIKETNLVSTDERWRTTAAKCYVWIKGNPIKAVLDSGAAVSIITNKLRRKLGIPIDVDSKVVVITANGIRERALGQINHVNINIQDIQIPMNLQVIDSTEDNLLLGTDWFEKTKA